MEGAKRDQHLQIQSLEVVGIEIQLGKLVAIREEQLWERRAPENERFEEGILLEIQFDERAGGDGERGDLGTGHGMELFQTAILLCEELEIGRGDQGVTDIAGEERSEWVYWLESGALGKVEVTEGREGERRGVEEMSNFVAEVKGKVGEGGQHGEEFAKEFVVNWRGGDDGEVLQGRRVAAAEVQDLSGTQDVGQRELLEVSQRRRMNRRQKEWKRRWDLIATER
jgi:hypothetical protein